MAYIGNQPANSYTSFDSQSLTGNGTAGPYTLSNAVSSANEIEVFVNFVRQRPGVAYTVAGNQLTMTGNVASTDDFYVVYQGKAVQTVVPPDGSVSTAQINNGAVTNAKINTMAASKLTGDVPSLTSGGRQSLASANGYTWTGIPSTAKKIIVVYRLYFTQAATINKSTILRVGNGSIVTSGYVSVSSYQTHDPYDGGDQDTTSFNTYYWGNGTQNQFGRYELTYLDNNGWVCAGQAVTTEVSGASTDTFISHGGYIGLGGALDRVQLKMYDGTSTYNANSEATLYYAS